jgi:hypothetical protein
MYWQGMPMSMSMPVKISYGGASAGFDLDDVLGKVSGLLNKDKNYVCLFLGTAIR